MIIGWHVHHTIEPGGLGVSRDRQLAGLGFWRRSSTRARWPLLQLRFQQIETDRLGDEFHGAELRRASAPITTPS